MGFEQQVEHTTAAVTHWRADAREVILRLWLVDARGHVVGNSTLTIKGGFLEEMYENHMTQVDNYMQPVIPWDD